MSKKAAGMTNFIISFSLASRLFQIKILLHSDFIFLNEGAALVTLVKCSFC
jgi:hypothetical protein